MVKPPRQKLLDHIAREAHIRRIVHLQKAYRLQWLVEQATFKVASLSCLEDADLIRLHRAVERARECIVDGISFEDAGLVETLTDTQDDDVHSKATRQMERDCDLASTGADRMVRQARREMDERPRFDDPPF